MRLLPPILASILLASATAESAERRETFPGPVSAAVRAVIDGDSFRADAAVWPGHTISVMVRIRGIDAPERRARCRAEREGARRAREALAGMIDGSTVIISNIGGAKYYGRVLADVATADGRLVAEALLALDLVRPYGGGRRAGWCG